MHSPTEEELAEQRDKQLKKPVVVSKELKSLNELLNLQNDANPSSSIIMMQRCAAIYGAMYFVNPSDSKSKEFRSFIG